MSYWHPPREKRESSSVIVDDNGNLLMSSMPPLSPFMLAQAGGNVAGSQEMHADASNQQQLMGNGNAQPSDQHRLLSNWNILMPDMNTRMRNQQQQQQQQLMSNGNFLLSELIAGPSSRNQLLPNGNFLLSDSNAGPSSRNQLLSNGNSLLPQMNSQFLNQHQQQSNQRFSLPDMNVEFSNQQSGSSLLAGVDAASNQWLLYNGNIISRSNRTYVNGRLLPPLAPKPQAGGSPPFLRNIDSYHENNSVNHLTLNERMVSAANPATMEKSRMVPPATLATMEMSRMVSPATPTTMEKSWMVSPATPETLDKSWMVSLATPATMEKSWRRRTQDLMPSEIIVLDDDEPETCQAVHQKESSTFQQPRTENLSGNRFSKEVDSSQNFSSYLKQFIAQTPQIPSCQQQFVGDDRAEQHSLNELESPPNCYQKGGQWNTVANSSQVLSSYQQGGVRNAAVNSRQIVSSFQLEGERNVVVDSSQNLSAYEREGDRNVVVNSSENVSVVQGDLENQGIDLNKTPSQKPKRKKHRPKVIREGKAARTPKMATPKPHTPGHAETTGNPVAKRKYVRKKKEPNAQNLSSTPMGEIVDPDSQNKNKSIPNVLGEVVDPDNQSVKKTARRSLNFDLEDSQQNVLEDATRGAAQEGVVTCNTISGMQSSQQQGLIELESSRGSGAKSPKRYQDSAHVSIGVSERIDRVIGNHMSRADPYDLEMHKRRRMEGGRNEQISNAVPTPPFPPSLYRPTYFLMGSNASEFTFADAQRLAHEKRQALERMLVSNQAMRETTNRPVQAHSPAYRGAVVDSHRVSTPIKVSSHSRLKFNQPPTPEKAPEYSNNLDHDLYGPQTHIELLKGSRVKPKAIKRKKKEQVPLNNSISSNGNQMDHVPASCGTDSSARTKSAQKNYSGKTTHVQTSAAQVYEANTNRKVSDSAGLQSRVVASWRNPIDEIIWKLMHLKIDGSHEDPTAEPQNALVPYAGAGGMIVPYDGSFELIKKKKPRPKVDLDPESNRVWNLLMGKESSEGEEGTDVDKEKWWEEERRVFRGRADSFIARMHLIQGDRRFSKWKGSVVDSVIGVFLTQNVSDHLSSSAFMCLAARFPPKPEGNNKTANAEMLSRPIAVHERSEQELCYQNLSGISESKQTEMGKLRQSPQNHNLGSSEGELCVGHESPCSTQGTTVTIASCTSAIECEDRPVEDVVSLQNSVASSQSSPECDGQIQVNLSPFLNFEAEESLNRGSTNGFSSFTELLHMESNWSGDLLDLNGSDNGRRSSAEHGYGVDCMAHSGTNKSLPVPNGPADLSHSGQSSIKCSSHFYPLQRDLLSLSSAPPSYCHKDSLNTGSVGLGKANVEENKSNQSHLTPLGISETNTIKIMGRQFVPCAGSSTNCTDQNKLLISNFAPSSYPRAPIIKNSAQPTTSSGTGVYRVNQSCSPSEASSERNCSSLCIHQQDGNAATYQEKGTGLETQMDRTRTEIRAQIPDCRTPQSCSNSHNIILRNGLDVLQENKSNLTNEGWTAQNASAETLNSQSKGKKVKTETKKKSFDWDSLRRQACQDGAKQERSRDTMDSLDYEAVRCADVHEVSHAIRERGMNNMLAERIKDFLNRLVKDHGSMDLEWLRDVPPDKAKDYLLSIRGLGLKSVECVRLLTLHHLAFPVDTNVGRICVRLGWVPLQTLPESLQLHLLEMYPVLETIQKYLWPRLCKLDQRTLYELHYQLITFGKVFCTKSRPNCNACPMRGECKHFASAFASARLALPGLEEKGIVPSEMPINSEAGYRPVSNFLPLPQLEGSTLTHERPAIRNCEPIIEEPASPEPECIGTSEFDIEDAFYNDPEEIPTIKLNLEEFTQNLQDYMQKNNMEIQDGDMSRALVAICPEAASIPTPKLKNVSRLRTEHQVYELPDRHPLLEGLDEREPDDPCPYLLAIWTPGETAQSTEPPTAFCNSQETGKLCNRQTCFSCNSIREAQAQMVRGTILIPCRTANRGSFPLNGTYFQVNEVFADHHSSRDPIDVPRDWIWNLPRRTVYFGTSIPSIFKGLTTEGIQHCFWRGFVCVRGFDRTSRAPKPLFARLHIAASKVTRNKKTTAAAAAGAAATKEVE